jgi:hypothetical protein
MKEDVTVFLAAGRPESWHPSAPTRVHAVTLDYEDQTAEKERASQPLRYYIGSFREPDG